MEARYARDIDLSNMSATELRVLAKKAAELAEALAAERPRYALALANGVRDTSYNTVRWGRIPSFTGTAIIQMEDGRRWKAIGHEPTGTAEYVSRDGYIEFVPLD